MALSPSQLLAQRPLLLDEQVHHTFLRVLMCYNGGKKGVHLMHAVVSLFDEHTTKAVKNLWTELAHDFGVRHLAEVLPYPHFSYQIARHYDESQLTSLVEQLAHQATPFSLQAGGMALFTGLHPVLYVPIVRTIELSHFHQKVWQVISRVGEGIPSYYEPNFWMPHITLAEHDGGSA